MKKSEKAKTRSETKNTMNLFEKNRVQVGKEKISSLVVIMDAATMLKTKIYHGTEFYLNQSIRKVIVMSKSKIITLKK